MCHDSVLCKGECLACQNEARNGRKATKCARCGHRSHLGFCHVAQPAGTAIRCHCTLQTPNGYEDVVRNA